MVYELQVWPQTYRYGVQYMHRHPRRRRGGGAAGRQVKRVGAELIIVGERLDRSAPTKTKQPASQPTTASQPASQPNSLTHSLTQTGSTTLLFCGVCWLACLLACLGPTTDHTSEVHHDDPSIAVSVLVSDW